MTSSVAVVRSPVDKTCHFLYFVDPATRRLVFEKRSIYTSKGHSLNSNDKFFEGIIWPSAPIAAVLQGDMVSVYGITEPNDLEGDMYLSKLSPTLDVLIDDLDMDEPRMISEVSMASCSDGRDLTFVYYLSDDPVSSDDELELNELELWGESNRGISTTRSLYLSEVSGLCAVIHRETLVRFIFYMSPNPSGTSSIVRWICSEDPSSSYVIGHMFKTSSILAATSRERIDHSVSYLDIFLYLLKPGDRHITRLVGRARGHSIEWFDPCMVLNPPTDEKSSLAVVNEDKRNYVYFIPTGKVKYEAYVDVIEDYWFWPQKK